MHILILLSLLGLSLSELTTYEEFITFSTKNHIRSVSDFANNNGFNNFDKEFEEFKTQFSKNYAKEEEELRQFYFLKSLQYIESHNEKYKNGDILHEVGLNDMADWTNEERKRMLNSEPMPFNITRMHESDMTFYENLPVSFDWRQQNKVTPVKSQGQCGACWAFATVATIESAQAIKHSQSISLSEQQLVDCAVGTKYKNSGCNGGWVPIAYQYIIDNGIELGSDYPYQTKQASCQNNNAKSHLRMNSFKQLTHPASDQEIMQAIMTVGPVAVNIDASGNDFGYYKTGILSTGNNVCNHYVTAIGWGTENNVNYWIVKNSWGAQWGEKGFAKMIRGKNIRNFNQLLFYPIIN